MLVTMTFDKQYWLAFDEKDVRQACRLNDCSCELIEDCIEEMKEGGNDCASCYIALCNELGAIPEYIPNLAR
jgi:hypothetical protein